MYTGECILPNKSEKPNREMSRSIKGIPNHVQEYLVCLVLHLALPLLPIILQLLATGKTDDSILTIAASMYAVSIGLSSRSKLFFVVGMVICILFAFTYGLSTLQPDDFTGKGIAALIAISAILLIHALERYNIHIVDREDFWLFESSKSIPSDKA